MLLKILPFALHTSPVSTGFAKEIMPILCILCYNSSLVTWTVVSLTTTKFKSLIFFVSGFALSYTKNMFILMILSPAQFCYIIIYVQQLCANSGWVCTLENFQWCAEPCFACAASLRGTCLPLIPKRDKRKSLPIWSVPYGVFFFGPMRL
jgi:hypothetical protein